MSESPVTNVMTHETLVPEAIVNETTAAQPIFDESTEWRKDPISGSITRRAGGFEEEIVVDRYAELMCEDAAEELQKVILASRPFH